LNAEGVKPDLIGDYQAIGFSTDSCLVKYNIPELTKLVISTFLDELHERNPSEYPVEVTQFDFK
jgi:hypothetical protein